MAEVPYTPLAASASSALQQANQMPGHEEMKHLMSSSSSPIPQATGPHAEEINQIMSAIPGAQNVGQQVPAGIGPKPVQTVQPKLDSSASIGATKSQSQKEAAMKAVGNVVSIAQAAHQNHIQIKERNAEELMTKIITAQMNPSEENKKFLQDLMYDKNAQKILKQGMQIDLFGNKPATPEQNGFKKAIGKIKESLGVGKSGGGNASQNPQEIPKLQPSGASQPVTSLLRQPTVTGQPTPEQVKMFDTQYNAAVKMAISKMDSGDYMSVMQMQHSIKAMELQAKDDHEKAYWHYKGEDLKLKTKEYMAKMAMEKYKADKIAGSKEEQQAYKATNDSLIHAMKLEKESSDNFTKEKALTQKYEAQLTNATKNKLDTSEIQKQLDQSKNRASAYSAQTEVAKKAREKAQTQSNEMQSIRNQRIGLLANPDDKTRQEEQKVVDDVDKDFNNWMTQLDTSLSGLTQLQKKMSGGVN